MKKIAYYHDLLKVMVAGHLNLSGLAQLLGVDLEMAALQLGKLKAHNVTRKDSHPIYVFDYADAPAAVELTHLSKLMEFARGGTPYKDYELSHFDKEYHQAGAYNPVKQAFVAGLRFKQLKNLDDYRKSPMNELFVVRDGFDALYFREPVTELAQTYLDIELQASMSGLYNLLSVLATVVHYYPGNLSGKPTFAGNMPEEPRDFAISLLYDLFGPDKNKALNPCGEAWLEVAPGREALDVKPFDMFVEKYNTTNERIDYRGLASTADRFVQGEKMMKVMYGCTLPTLMKFYSKLSPEGDGMAIIGPPVFNPVYAGKEVEGADANGGIEVPIYCDKNKISTIYMTLLADAAAYEKMREA